MSLDQMKKMLEVIEIQQKNLDEQVKWLEALSDKVKILEEDRDMLKRTVHSNIETIENILDGLKVPRDPDPKQHAEPQRFHTG